jgi:hypothetical protein
MSTNQKSCMVPRYLVVSQNQRTLDSDIINESVIIGECVALLS